MEEYHPFSVSKDIDSVMTWCEYVWPPHPDLSHNCIEYNILFLSVYRDTLTVWSGKKSDIIALNSTKQRGVPPQQ